MLENTYNTNQNILYQKGHFLELQKLKWNIYYHLSFYTTLYRNKQTNKLNETLTTITFSFPKTWHK